MASDRAEQFIKALVAATQARSMYGDKHRLAKEALDRLYIVLEEILAGQEEMTMGVIGDEVAFEKEPLYEISRRASDLISRMKDMKFEKITFARGVKKNEVEQLIGLIASKSVTVTTDEDLKKIVASTDIRNIAVGKIGFIRDEAEDTDDLSAITKRTYQETLDFLKKASEDIKKNMPIDVQSARRLVHSIVTNLLKNKNLLLILTSTKSHDESTFVHDINVSIFTLLQAEALGFGEEYLGDIGVAALMHDAGKLSIPGEILRKKDKLTEEERESILHHPVQGAKILLETAGISPLAAIAAFEHHVSFDRAGYPERLFKEQTNLVSMMVSISDYYDALRSKRYYRDEMAPEKTYEDMIKLSGKQFHPDLLTNFFGVIGVYPPGTLVELNTGEIGIVIRESALDIRRPQVEILYSKGGEKNKSSRVVNLLDKDGDDSYKWSIVKSILPSDKFKVSEKYL